VWDAEASDVNAEKEAEARADEALAENADVPADVMAAAEDMYGGDRKIERGSNNGLEDRY
jgi:hypothetical protein